MNWARVPSAPVAVLQARVHCEECQASQAEQIEIRISVAARSTGTRGFLESKWEKPEGMGRDTLFDQERGILRS